MTGGTVVVLGSTGRNFAAGMSGGISYVFDPHKQLKMNTNLSMVGLETLMTVQEQKEKNPPELRHLGEFDEVQLKELIENHFFWTKSALAKNILDKWEKNVKNFVKVFPHEYKRALSELQKSKTEGTKQLV
jgi:glutamate synthase domain-containing protein 3